MSFRNGQKSESYARLFQPVSQWVQINLIFNNNVHILCLSCNIKKSKTTAKLSENSWNKCHSNCFQWRHLWCQVLILLPFLSVIVHESGTRLNNLKFIWPPLLVLKITQLQDKQMAIKSKYTSWLKGSRNKIKSYINLFPCSIMYTSMIFHA